MTAQVWAAVVSGVALLVATYVGSSHKDEKKPDDRNAATVSEDAKGDLAGLRKKIDELSSTLVQRDREVADLRQRVIDECGKNQTDILADTNKLRTRLRGTCTSKTAPATCQTVDRWLHFSGDPMDGDARLIDMDSAIAIPGGARVWVRFDERSPFGAKLQIYSDAQYEFYCASGSFSQVQSRNMTLGDPGQSNTLPIKDVSRSPVLPETVLERAYDIVCK